MITFLELREIFETYNPAAQFVIFNTKNRAVLGGAVGSEAVKEKARQIRQQKNLKFDEVSFMTSKRFYGGSTWQQGGVMSHHNLMVEEFLKRQAAARKVLLAIKKSRKRETLPSALQIADAPLAVSEEHSFYIFRTDTNAVLAKGIQGFEAAKSRANELRKSHGLKWDQVKFKAERGNQSIGGAAGGSGGSAAAAPIRKKKTTFDKPPSTWKYGSGYADQGQGGTKIRTTYKDWDEATEHPKSSSG
jgi:hypothetical protein